MRPLRKPVSETLAQWPTDKKEYLVLTVSNTLESGFDDLYFEQKFTLCLGNFYVPTYVSCHALTPRMCTPAFEAVAVCM